MKNIITVLILSFTLAQAQQTPQDPTKPVAHELVAKINQLHPEGQVLINNFINTGRQNEWQKSPGHIALLNAIRDYQRQLDLIKKQGQQSATDDAIIKQSYTLKQFHTRVEELTNFIKIPKLTLQEIQTWLDETDISLLPYLQPYNQRRLTWLALQEDKKRTFAAQATDQRVAQLQREVSQARAERQRLEREIDNQPTPAPVVIIQPSSDTPYCPPPAPRPRPVHPRKPSPPAKPAPIPRNPTKDPRLPRLFNGQ